MRLNFSKEVTYRITKLNIKYLLYVSYLPSKVMSKVVRHRLSGVSKESPYIGLRRFILWQKPDSTCPRILCLAPGMMTYEKSNLLINYYFQ